MRAAFLAAAAAVGLLAVATSAHANGRFPQSNQILFSPTQPGLIVVRNSFGIDVSKDGGNSWYWLCEDAVGLPPMSNEDPFLGVTSNDSLVAGMLPPNGLKVSSDLGCNWTMETGLLAGQLIKDLVVHKDNPHVVDTITNTFGMVGNDGGYGFVNQLFETTDDGANWAPFGTWVDPNYEITTIEVAPSDPNRIYVSGFTGGGTTRTASLFVSKDHGTTWTEHQTPLDTTTETAAYIGGVDPNDADVVYLRTQGISRLIVTQDGGQTFQSSKQLTADMLGFALSPDGSKIYIGSVDDGIFVGDKVTLTFVSTNPKVQVNCLVTQGNDLWACSNEASGFEAGVSHDDGKTFTPKMHLLSIQAPVQCGADAAAAICAGPPFVSLCSRLGGCNELDAGSLLPLQSTCSCSGVCTDMVYDAEANCPIVNNDAGLPPMGDAAANDGGNNGSSGSSGSSSGASGASSSGGGGVGAGSKSKSGCGCGLVGGGRALGFVAGAAGIAALAARRRRKRMETNPFAS